MAEQPDTTGIVQLLSRLDERTLAIQSEITNFRSDMKHQSDNLNQRIEASEKKTNEDIKTLKDSIEKFEIAVEKDYVRKDTFSPIERLVYGLVGLILLSFFVALIAYVIPTVPLSPK